MELGDWEKAIEALCNKEDMNLSEKVDMLRDLRTRVEGGMEFLEDMQSPKIQARRDLLKDIILTVDEALDQLGDDVTLTKPRPKWNTEDVRAFHEEPGALERLRASQQE